MPRRLPRWLPPDAVVALVAFVFCTSGAAIVGAQAGEPDLTAGACAVLALQCAPLVWRRRAPIVVWAVSGLAAVWYGAMDWPDPLLPLGAFIALATVVECLSRRAALVVWLVSAASATLSLVVAGDSDAVDVWVTVVTLVFAPLLGDQQRNRNAYLRQVEEGASRARSERQPRRPRSSSSRREPIWPASFTTWWPTTSA